MVVPIAATNSAIIAVAAIHAKRLQDIADAFRVAGATVVDRARAPSELGLAEHERQIKEYEEASVLRAGARPGTYYFDEQAYIDHRERSKRKAGVGVLIALAVMLAILGIALVVQMARR